MSCITRMGSWYGIIPKANYVKFARFVSLAVSEKGKKTRLLFLFSSNLLYNNYQIMFL